MRLSKNGRTASSVLRSNYTKLALIKAEMLKEDGFAVQIPHLVDTCIDLLTREDIKTAYINSLIEKHNKRKKK
jgi:hypothetical protein